MTYNHEDIPEHLREHLREEKRTPEEKYDRLDAEVRRLSEIAYQREHTCKPDCVLGEAHFEYFRKDEVTGTVWNIILGDITAPGVYSERLPCMNKEEYDRWSEEYGGW